MRLFVLGFILLASANSEPPKQAAVECQYNGKTFKPGDLVTGDKCDPCFCSSIGAVYCTRRQCPPVMCVDAAIPDGECCPVCPNADGTISNSEYVYKFDNWIDFQKSR